MTEMQKEKRKKNVTTKGNIEYSQILNHHNEISKIMETRSLQHQYDLCSQAIEDSIEKLKDYQKRI